jgi:hypothetical protein
VAKRLLFSTWFVLENTIISIIVQAFITKSFNPYFAVGIFVLSIILVLPFSTVQPVKSLYQAGTKLTSATTIATMYISAVLRFAQASAEFPAANKLPIFALIGLLGIVVLISVIKNMRDGYSILSRETLG